MNKDTRDILALVARSPEGRHTLATVIGVVGSSYRRSGARLLVHGSGLVVGSVSGGCLDGAIARRGGWWAERGAVVRRFDSARADLTFDDRNGEREEADRGDGDGDEHAVTGCGGTVEVLIERVGSADPEGPLAALQWTATRRAPSCIATVTSGAPGVPAGTRFALTRDEVWAGMGAELLLAAARADALRVLASGKSVRRAVSLPDGEVDVFFEHVAPSRELLVAGRHHDVAPLVRIARAVGWEVTSAASGVTGRALGEPDHRIDATPTAVAAWSTRHRGAAIVLMTHSAPLDRELLAATLASSRPGFLGVLGPAHRTRDLLRGLELPVAALSSLRTPIGLDLGGDGPEAIALSIVADLQAWWHGRSGARLCSPGSVGWCDRARLADAS